MKATDLLPMDEQFNDHDNLFKQILNFPFKAMMCSLSADLSHHKISIIFEN